MRLNCGVGEDSWEPLGLQKIQPVHLKGDQSWVFIGRTDVEAETPNSLATWCEELTHLKRPWCWERLRAREEGGNRGWDGWMASPTQWTWVWVNSGSWWWTGRPGVLQFMGWQRVRHDWTTELNTKGMHYENNIKYIPVHSNPFLSNKDFDLSNNIVLDILLWLFPSLKLILSLQPASKILNTRTESSTFLKKGFVFQQLI